MSTKTSRCLGLLAPLLALSLEHCRGRSAQPPAPRGPATAPTAPAAAPATASTTFEEDPNRPAWAASPLEDALPPEEVERAFNAAGDSPATLQSGVLLCRATASNDHQWDTPIVALFTIGIVDHTAPDITFRLHVGDGPEQVSAWRDDSHVGFGGFAQVTLQPGARLTLRLDDRDTVVRLTRRTLIGSDTIGTATSQWNGAWPLVFRDSLFTAECRGVSGDAAVQRARVALSDFDREAATLSRARERGGPLGPELYPSARFSRARASLRTAAGWVGWSHPEVLARVATSNGLDQRAIETLTRAISRTDGDPVGSTQRFSEGTVKLQRWRCDEAFMRSLDAQRPAVCAALIEVAVRPGGSAQHGNLTRVTLHAPIDAPASLDRCWMSADGATWQPACEAAPGQTVTFAFATDDALPAQRDPWTTPSVLEVRPFFSREPVRYRLAP